MPKVPWRVGRVVNMGLSPRCVSRVPSRTTGTHDGSWGVFGEFAPVASPSCSPSRLSIVPNPFLPASGRKGRSIGSEDGL